MKNCHVIARSPLFSGRRDNHSANSLSLRGTKQSHVYIGKIASSASLLRNDTKFLILTLFYYNFIK